MARRRRKAGDDADDASSSSSSHKQASPIPAGMYIELNASAINDGSFIEKINTSLRDGFRELLRWEEASGETDGVLEVTATLKISRMPKSDEHWVIEDAVKRKLPAFKQQSIAKGAGGRLICQPEGTSADAPEQMRLFDAKGRPKGTLDLETGELIEDDEELERAGVAGRVG